MYRVVVRLRIDGIETWEDYTVPSKWEVKRLQRLVGCEVNGVEYMEVDWSPSNGMNG
jgi:hypothetical protein